MVAAPKMLLISSRPCSKASPGTSARNLENASGERRKADAFRQERSDDCQQTTAVPLNETISMPVF
jgi:hypothetical protein